MLEKIKDILYDLSDFLLMLVIVAVIIFSISSIMSSTFGIDLQNNASTNIAKEKIAKVDKKQPEEKATDVDKSKNDEEKTDVDKPKDDEENKDKKDNSTEAQTNTDEENKDNTDSTKTDKKEEQTNKSSTTDNSTTNGENNEVSFTINPGDTPLKVCKDLKAKNIISDTSKFLNLLVKKKLDTKLRIGTVKLRQNMSDEEVLKVMFK